jgi:hypothetical protein
MLLLPALSQWDESTFGEMLVGACVNPVFAGIHSIFPPLRGKYYKLNLSALCDLRERSERAVKIYNLKL